MFCPLSAKLREGLESAWILAFTTCLSEVPVVIGLQAGVISGSSSTGHKGLRIQYRVLELQSRSLVRAGRNSPAPFRVC